MVGRFLTCFKIMQHVPGRTKEAHEIRRSGQPNKILIQDLSNTRQKCRTLVSDIQSGLAYRVGIFVLISHKAAKLELYDKVKR
jgi:hypothetical protein